MAQEVKLSRIDTVLTELSYPASKREVLSALDDVTLLYADGRESARAVVERSGAEEFESADDLRSEIFNCLPTEAVGEPGQSEGEG